MAHILEKELLDDCRKVFQRYDTSRTGKLNYEQLRTLLKDMSMSYTDSEVKDLMYNIVQSSLIQQQNGGKDANNDELKIEFHDFLNIMIMNLKDSEPDSDLKAAFKAMDSDGDGLITPADLKSAFNKFSFVTGEQPITDDEVKAMLKTVNGYTSRVNLDDISLLLYGQSSKGVE